MIGPGIALHHDGLSRPLVNPKRRVLSLGAGVQSSVLALMSARGDLPRLDAAIFADTGWEPIAVYEWLDWLEKQLPFPVLRVRRSGPDLGQHAMQIAESPVTRTASPPWFTADPDGFLPKQCSKEYKTRVVTGELRRQLGLKPRQRGPKRPVIEQWIGMSSDELERLRNRGDQPFIHVRYPLVEARMNRRDCLRYMEERQLPAPPKSSCIFCPYRGNDQWRAMRESAPADWAMAVAFDAAIRPGFHGMQGSAFVHRQRVPLDQVDLDRNDDPQGRFGFANECEGVCAT